MFDSIHLLHSQAKFLVREVSLSNFRIKNDRVKLMINFRYDLNYQDKYGVHFSQFNKEFKGDPVTGSISAMEGFNHSRRDDLESLAYSFMLLIDSSKVIWSSETD
jgi:hypothetical protein